MGRLKFLYSPSELYKVNDPSWNGSWENVEYDKRLQFILESVDIFNKTLIRQNIDTVDFYSVRKSCRLNMDEKAIYLRHMDAPEIPPLKPALFFKQQSEIKNNSLSQNSNEDMEDLFSKLSRAEKFDCYKKHIEALELYCEFEKDWREQQRDKLAIYLNELFCKKHPHGILTNVSRNRIKEIREVKHEVTATQMATFTSVFKFPPMSVHKLFKNIKGYKGTTSDLHQFLKVVLFEILNDIKKTFAKETLEYVDKLDISDKKLFIGINRKLYVSKFGGEDIFEELYPAENFPAFIFNSLNRSLKIESDDEYFLNESIEENEVKLNVNLTIPEDFDPTLAVRNSIRTLFENLNSKSKW